METQTEKVIHFPQNNLLSVCEFVRDIGKHPTALTRDDFYSEMCIHSLAAIPAHTETHPLFPDITVTYGPGATAAFTRLRMGKCDTTKKFSEACRALANYLDDNYADNISLDPPLTASDIEKTITALSNDRRAKETFSTTKIKILLMPAVATEDTHGLVYIHTKDAAASQSYTVVIPQHRELASKKRLMHLLVEELTVCICNHPGNSSDVTRTFDSIQLPDNMPLIFCRKNNQQDAQNLLIRIDQSYPSTLSDMYRLANLS